jgi:hypothetical protein
VVEDIAFAQSPDELKNVNAFSHIETTTHLNRKVGTLLPTFDIKDPQVRAFCDSLTNAWQLRNGNTGFDDKERFITKQEWDFLAKNRTSSLSQDSVNRVRACLNRVLRGTGEGGGGGRGFWWHPADRLS